MYPSYDVDIDECATGEHECTQQCKNEHGGYMCLCDDGYQLAADKVTCEGMSALSYFLKTD